MAGNMLEVGASYLADAFTAHASIPVTYRRGLASSPLTGTPGNKLLKAADGLGGGRLMKSDLDLVIPAAGLVLDGAATEPRPGDRVEVLRGAERHTYEVRPPFEGEPAWQYLPGGTLIRLHLTRVGVDRA